MKLSFNSWLYGSAFGWTPVRSLEDTMDTLAEIGYDGIEIGAAAPHAFPRHLSGERRKQIVAHADKRGLEISALCPALGGGPGYNPASPDAEERAEGLQYIKECVELAHDLNCENVIWLAGWKQYRQPRKEAWAHAVEALRQGAEFARPLGVKLVVEPTSEVSDVIEHAGDVLRLMEEASVGPEVAGAMLDTIHIFYRGDEVRSAFEEAGDRLYYVHISDIDRQPPGTHTDFRGAVDELNLLGYQGWLSMEIGFPRRERDPDGVARKAHDYMREVIETSAGRTAEWRKAHALAGDAA